MPKKSEKVKQVEKLLAAGLGVSEALYRALGGSTAFADRHGFKQPTVSMCFRAYHQRTYANIRDAACLELDCTRAWLDSLIDGQRTTDGAVA